MLKTYLSLLPCPSCREDFHTTCCYQSMRKLTRHTLALTTKQERFSKFIKEARTKSVKIENSGRKAAGQVIVVERNGSWSDTRTRVREAFQTKSTPKNLRREESFPNSAGMVPLRLHALRKRYSRLRKSPNSVGIEELSLFGPR